MCFSRSIVGVGGGGVFCSSFSLCACITSDNGQYVCGRNLQWKWKTKRIEFCEAVFASCNSTL